MRRDKDRIYARIVTFECGLRIHIDRDIRRTSSKVETCQRIVFMQQAGDLANIGTNSGNVRCSRERTNTLPILVPRVLQKFLKVCEIHVAGRIQSHLYRRSQ